VPGPLWRLRPGFGQIKANRGDALENDLLAPDTINGGDGVDKLPVRRKDDVRRLDPRANRLNVRAQPRSKRLSGVPFSAGSNR